MLQRSITTSDAPHLNGAIGVGLASRDDACRNWAWHDRRRSGQVATTIRANQAERAKTLQAAYDCIVVGTGSAGSALIGRLAAARPDASILVLEAGDWDTARAVMDPSVWFTNLGTDRDWKDVAIASPSTNNRAIPEHMGKVVGGGCSINATIWARPFKHDLDHWAAESGDTAWGYEQLGHAAHRRRCHHGQLRLDR